MEKSIPKLLAQTTLGQIGGDGLGPMGNIINKLGTGTTTFGGTQALMAITNVVSLVIGVMTISAGIWFIFMFIVGAYTWMTSMGEKAKLQQARDRIVNALIGLVILISAVSILSLVGQFFGWDITITDPGAIIENLNFN